MADGILIRVDPKLKELLSKIQEKIGKEVKEKYHLDKITIHGTMASRYLAEEFNGKKEIEFKISKTTLTSGIIEIC